MSGRSAVFFAAENGYDTATAILLAFGADPNQKDTVYMLKLNTLLSKTHPCMLHVYIYAGWGNCIICC